MRRVAGSRAGRTAPSARGSMESNNTKGPLCRFLGQSRVAHDGVRIANPHG
jgi:hypothetical protein